MNGQLLLQGFELLLLGMGIVFGFLILLVFMLRAMSGLAARFEPEESAPPVLPAVESTTDDGALIAAISIAVARYRASHRV
jgi:oxaloacetate decarboxylase gamma subunit